MIEAGTTFTGVSSYWTVPAVVPSAGPQYAAAWIGVGGVGSSQLIQTGTTSETTAYSTSYFAWYELLPAASVTIARPVSPGDVMLAVVRQTSVGIWFIGIEDVSQGWTVEGTVTYTAGLADSAEWVVERPEVNSALSSLADFQSVRFHDLRLAGSDLTTSYATPAYMVNTTTKIIAYPGKAVATTTGSFIDYYGTPLPTVTSVSPSQGSTAGGTTVMITGTYLVPGLVESVHFGADVAHGDIYPDGAIVVTAPAEPAGTVAVTVTTTDGSSQSTGADRFTYVTPSPPSPSPPSPSPPPSSTPSPSPTPPSSPTSAPTPGPSAASTTSGYDMVGSDGGVFVFPAGQTAGYHGSLPGDDVQVSDVVGMVPTPSDAGYFLVGSDGGVFSFGNAPFLGSLPGDHVAVDDIRGIVPTANNGGYFLVGSDGGVFTFGDAPFLGSLPGSGVHTNDVVGIAATPNDQGYWLVTGTGTVYSFGDARNDGSVTGTSSPVAGIDSTPDGGGYWVVTQNGGVYTFGDAGYFGSLPESGVTPSRPIIGLVPTSDEKGYWLIGSDGGIFAYGDATFQGSLPQIGVNVTDVVGAVPTDTSAGP